MITTKVDISKSTVEHLNLINDDEARELIGKGWSLSFVYSFKEIRDVYLAFCKYGQNGTITEFSNKHVRGIVPYANNPWDEKGRRVLEIKNALINFGIMDKKTLECKKGVFKEVEPGAPLSKADKQVFREIFFNYFRFLEFSSLFISPFLTIDEKQALTESRLLNESNVLYYYASKGNRIDTFFYDLKNPSILFQFPYSEMGIVKGGFVRFWDTFLSWASQLELIERLNMKRQGIFLSNGKSFNACYFVKPNSNIDVFKLLRTRFKKQSLIDISNLVMEFCLQYRCSIKDGQQAVINFYQSQPNNVSLIRTSEIFIKETELKKNDRILYPKYKGSFVSHIKLRNYE